MPSDERLRTWIFEVSKAIESLGYYVDDIVGPVTESGEEISQEEAQEIQDEEEREFGYHLTGSTVDGDSFYFTFSSSNEYLVAAYPLSLSDWFRHSLEEQEVNQIIESAQDDFDRDELDDDQISKLVLDSLVSNTNDAVSRRIAFNLSNLSSSPLVGYDDVTTEDGFPYRYKSHRALFPVEVKISPQSVERVLFPVMNAGDRGRRYIKYSIQIDHSNESPENYSLSLLF